jgi:hypothetical protein
MVDLTYHDALMNRLSSINQLGIDATNSARALAQQRAAERVAQEQQQMQSLQQQAYNRGLSTRNNSNNSNYSSGYIPPSRGAGNTFENFMHAISQRESGGRYGAVNPDSGALGKYQIMPGNIRSWSRQALGYYISPQQFLRTPALQERIAQNMLRNYYNQYGPGGAAVAWYAGPGTAAKWVRNNSGYNRPQGKYSSINAYALGILRAMGLR